MSPPQRLGKYQITEVIGEGAMGIVYKAFDPDIRRIVALKTIRQSFAEGSEAARSAAARFRNEAQAGGRLAHPGIVGVFDFGEHEGTRFIAMEYVEGQSLARYAGSGVRFTDDDIPGVMSQLLDALEHAHRQGVWHRDIKPANIIMTRSGRLKVADFGIARIDDHAMTQVNTLVGTPTYMAPEQITGKPIDHRVDIYSAGVLLYLLLTGQAPFVGPIESTIYRVVHEKPPAPSQAEGCQRPRFYDALVATALEKDPDLRYPSAATFKAALAAAVGRPFDDACWDQTIIGAPLPAAPSAASGAATGSTGSNALRSQPATVWDRALLAQAEASLARFVGPLAGVLVRRAANECTDAPALYSKLAEQITGASARAAFLGSSMSGRVATPAAQAPAATDAQPALAEPLSEALVTQSVRLLAELIGPIARVVGKRAAARAPNREAFFAALAEAVDDAGKRARLQAELARLR